MGLAPYRRTPLYGRNLRQTCRFETGLYFWLNLEYLLTRGGTDDVGRDLKDNLFGGPPRAPEGKVERRHMDVAPLGPGGHRRGHAAAGETRPRAHGRTSAGGAVLSGSIASPTGESYASKSSSGLGSNRLPGIRGTLGPRYPPGLRNKTEPIASPNGHSDSMQGSGARRIRTRRSRLCFSVHRPGAVARTHGQAARRW